MYLIIKFPYLNKNYTDRSQFINIFFKKSVIIFFYFNHKNRLINVLVKKHCYQFNLILVIMTDIIVFIGFHLKNQKNQKLFQFHFLNILI